MHAVNEFILVDGLAHINLTCLPNESRLGIFNYAANIKYIKITDFMTTIISYIAQSYSETQ